MAGTTKSSKRKTTAKAEDQEQDDLGTLMEVVKRQDLAIMFLEQSVAALENEKPDGYFPKLSDRKVMYERDNIATAGNDSRQAMAYRETQTQAAERIGGAAERADAVDRKQKGVGNDEDANVDPEGDQGSEGSTGTVQAGVGGREGTNQDTNPEGEPAGPTASTGDKTPEGTTGPTGPAGATGSTGATGSRNRSG